LDEFIGVYRSGMMNARTLWRARLYEDLARGACRVRRQSWRERSFSFI